MAKSTGFPDFENIFSTPGLSPTIQSPRALCVRYGLPVPSPATAETPWLLDINNLSFKQNILVNQQHHNLLKYCGQVLQKPEALDSAFLAKTKPGET
jgi:hypothetical protein